jgi:Ca-activated chloride channel homolog
MKRRITFSLTATLVLFSLGYFLLPANFAVGFSNTVEAAPRKVTQGALQITSPDGEPRGDCPLKHTAVKASVSGPLARVTVTQEFHNPLSEKIEAVYVFPLPNNAAVDDMTMVIGERVVKGKIKRREEARAVYEAARAAGQVASLLDQERPNIFTQSVANILPGATVKVVISYVETMKYEDGTYQFVFPMVVGPRYIPGQPIAQPNLNTAPDTSQVPDASRITPPITPEGRRAGHDISIEVNIDAGVPLDSIQSTLHEIETERPNPHAAPHSAIVRLKNRTTIPNKDFILKLDVAGKKVADALLAHRSQQGGFFTLLFQPPERVTANDVMPKELVFVLDTSGSMHGFPIEKAKEVMKLALDGLYPQDTFNLITFSGDTHILFPEPVPATRANLAKAQAFLESRQGSGGTEMMKAIRAALDPSDKQDHLRIVCFMTDGYVGNDMQIIAEVQKHPNARVFSFGIGGSVNRFLLDKMAEHGRGEVEYVTLQDDGSAAAKRFHERVRNPLFIDIEVDWGGLPVADVYPKRLPDLFSAKPLVLTGRYTAGARGVIRVRGKLAGQTVVRELPVELPEVQPQHDVLLTLWARTRIEDLMSQDFNGIQQGTPREELREAITQLGLEYRLMTQFTSFVAVEEAVVTDGGQPRRIDVPVEMPEGVSYEAIFGEKEEKDRISRAIPSRKVLNFADVAAGTAAVPRERLNQGAVVYNQGQSAGASKGQLPPVTINSPTAPPPPAKPTPISSNEIKVSGGVLQSSATHKVQPTYPATARAARASGSVQVLITVDENGQVQATQIISGHPLLRAAALEAARQWRFNPTQLSGKPIKMQGVLTFNFELDKNAVSSEPAAPLTPSPEERAAQHLRAKLHPSLLAVVERLKNKTAQPTAAEAKFVRNGKAELQIWLTEKSPAVIAELQKLGFEVILNPATSKLLIGRLPLEKLAALAELSAVKYVAPQLQ